MIGITTNFDEFNRSLHAELEKHNLKTRQGVRKLAIQTHANIQEASPVDTGLFKASHDLTLGEPSGWEPPPSDDRAANEALAQQKHQEARATMNTVLIKHLAGLSIFITSNLSYANRIEHGHSQQAPKGVYLVESARAERNAERITA